MRLDAPIRAAAAVAEWEAPRLLRLASAEDADERVRIASRALAARNLATAAVLATGPSRRVRRVVVAIDCAHAASMVALAAVSSGYRRPALVSAAVTTALAIATM
jgi:hypothetical protein